MYSAFAFPLSARLPGVITWVPFYLSLILLLQTLTLPEIHASKFGDPCEKNRDCTDTFFCSKPKNQCDCIKLETKNLVSFYNRDTKECVSIVDKSCTLVETSNTMFTKCVPYASCKVPGLNDMKHLAKNLGVCKCNEGYEKSAHGLCVSIPTPGRSDLGPFGPVVMENGGGGNLPTAASSTNNKDDHNSAVDVVIEAAKFAYNNTATLLVSDLVKHSALVCIVLFYYNALR